jgi:hypothetical protein
MSRIIASLSWRRCDFRAGGSVNLRPSNVGYRHRALQVVIAAAQLALPLE